MRVNRNVYVACLAAAFCFAGLSSAQIRSSEEQAGIGIENFGRINSNYYRGAQPEGDDYARLAALGVKTIIDLQREGEADEQRIVESLGMKFFRIGMSTKTRPRPEQVREFLAIVNDAANQPVFVHCRAGRHRTGIMTAIYRMTRDHWTPNDAYAEMKEYEFEKGFGHGALRKYVYEVSAGEFTTAVDGGPAATASHH